MKIKMILKECFKIAAGAAFVALVFNLPNLKAVASSTSTATTFHAVVLKEGDSAAETDSDTTYSIVSTGTVAVDNDGNNEEEIVICAEDLNKLAHYVNTLNSYSKSSYDTTVTAKRSTEKIFTGIGYGTVNNVGTSGFAKVNDTLDKTENIITAIGY